MKKATITIKKANVIKDIEAITYKRIDGEMSSQNDQVKNALATDMEENLDLQLLYRYMERRDAVLREKLAFCIIDEDEGELSASNDILTDDSYIFTLNVPDKFNKERLKALTQKIHQYYVDGTAYDWHTKQGVDYSVGTGELNDMLSSIVVSLRNSFVKKPLQPFGPAI